MFLLPSPTELFEHSSIRKESNRESRGKLFESLFICLLGIHLIPQLWGRRATMQKKIDKKERTKEGDKQRKTGSRQNSKPFTSILTNDVLIGEVEQNRNQKEEQKKETGSGSPNQLPWNYQKEQRKIHSQPFRSAQTLRKVQKFA